MPDFGRWTSNGGDPSLNEINRTDRFLDALAFERPVYATDPGEAELAQSAGRLARRRPRHPADSPADPRDAVVALDAAHRVSRPRQGVLALVGSAAAAVLCLGGFGAWSPAPAPVTRCTACARCCSASNRCRGRRRRAGRADEMAEVQQLIDQGQWDAAQDKLETLTTTVNTVNDVSVTGTGHPVASS